MEATHSVSQTQEGEPMPCFALRDFLEISVLPSQALGAKKESQLVGIIFYLAENKTLTMQ